VANWDVTHNLALFVVDEDVRVLAILLPNSVIGSNLINSLINPIVLGLGHVLNPVIDPAPRLPALDLRILILISVIRNLQVMISKLHNLAWLVESFCDDRLHDHVTKGGHDRLKKFF
jgi:hypothetical protein